MCNRYSLFFMTSNLPTDLKQSMRIHSFIYFRNYLRKKCIKNIWARIYFIKEEANALFSSPTLIPKNAQFINIFLEYGI